MQVLTIIGFVLLLVGFILAAVEMILPGFGIPGILSAICFIAGVIMAANTIEQAVTLTVIIVVVLAIMLTVVIVLFHFKKMKSPIRLDEELGKGEGFLSSDDLAFLVGKEGMTTTVLRPTGKCEIEGISFEVRSEIGYIEKGRKIVVVKIQSGAIVVKEV